jgi:hypothetical protein
MNAAAVGIADATPWRASCAPIRAKELLPIAIGCRLNSATPDILAYPTDRAAWSPRRLLTVGNKRAEKVTASCSSTTCSNRRRASLILIPPHSASTRPALSYACA